MNRWIEKQRHLIDFTASSLARRKGKSLGLLVVYTLLVFVLASVSLVSPGPTDDPPSVASVTPVLLWLPNVSPGGVSPAPVGHAPHSGSNMVSVARVRPTE